MIKDLFLNTKNSLDLDDCTSCDNDKNDIFDSLERLKNPEKRWSLDDLENNIDLQFG